MPWLLDMEDPAHFIDEEVIIGLAKGKLAT